MTPYQITPHEIYNLPTTETVSWFDKEDLVFDLFSLEYGEINTDSARESGLSTVEISTKLSCYVNENDSYVRISCISVNGEFFALVKDANNGLTREFIVTDLEKFQEAKKEIENWRKSNEPDKPDVVSDDTAINDVYCSTFIIKHENEVRLVPVNYLNIHGTKILFDERKYETAFDEIVRPAFEGTDVYISFVAGLKNPLMRELACKAIEAAIPTGIERIVLNVDSIKGLKQSHQDNWHAVLVKDGEETYSIGVSPYYKTHESFSWSKGLHGCYIGSSKIYDKIALIRNKDSDVTLDINDKSLERSMM